MKLFFYRPNIPNFGDLLNEWLWPKIFPDFFDQDESVLFIGIGTILDDRIPAFPLKIIFGSGVRYPDRPPKIDSKWDIRALRGKLSAKILNANEKLVITDPAVLVRNFFLPPKEEQHKKYEIVYIPYFRSVSKEWQYACKLAGLEYLDPRLPVDKCLLKIWQSRFIITEAMHGAIIADTFRVPWLPVRSFNAFHEGITHSFKWQDWCSSLGLNFKPIDFPILWPSSSIISKTKNIFKIFYIAMSFVKLKKDKNLVFLLSEDKILNQLIDRYMETILKFKLDYGII